MGIGQPCNWSDVAMRSLMHLERNYRELFLDPLHFPRYKIPLYSMAFRENFGAVMGGFRKKNLVVGVELFVADPS